MSKKSKYLLPKYKVLFSEKLAERYKPIIYSHECLSGPPEAVYYRIIAKEQQTRKKQLLLLLCIQYFFYWAYQRCIGASHRYDYEPIFIYVEEKEKESNNNNNNYKDTNNNNSNPSPYLIVNGGLGGPDCNFHKIEIRPKSGKRERFGVHFDVKMSPKEYYPFGKDGNVKYKGCSHQYPLKGGRDLKFKKDSHPLFGIRACSNVFSGADYDLQGAIFNPPLKRLSDRVLTQWYFRHYNHKEDMPFGHDVADPFTYPYIKYHCAREKLPVP